MRFLLILLLISFSHNSLATQIYRWVDKQGNTHFSQTKPYQYPTNKLNIPESKVDSKTAKERLNKQIESLNKRQEDYRLKQQKGKKAVAEKHTSDAYCSSISSNLSVLNSGGPARVEGATSDMTAEEKKQAIASLQLKYKANCSQ